MTSPEMQELIASLSESRRRRAGQPAPSIEERRAAFSPAGRQHPIPSDVSVSSVLADGVPVHWLSSPGVDPNLVLFFLHGGGYSLGSLQSHGELAARIGRASGTTVVLVEYRLAPEHPFPAALEDALTAWRWLHREQGGRGEATCAIIGDSAGGGLAVALLAALRDTGEQLPACAVLLSPWVDLSCSGASIGTAPDPVLVPQGLAVLASTYLAGADATNPLASPLFASLEALPPLLIQAGTAELLLSDSERLAQAARFAGVEVVLQIAEEMPHVYQSMLGTPEAARATSAIAAFLRSRLIDPEGDAGAPEVSLAGRRSDIRAADLQRSNREG